MYKRQTRLPTFCTSLFSSFSSTHQRIPAQVYISNMSWDSYITNLMAPGTDGKPSPVEDAAIWGFEPGAESVWAASKGLTAITVDEIKKLVNGRKDFPVNGAYLGGKRCMFLRDNMDVESVFNCTFKTKADDDGTTKSVCVGKTNKAFVIAFGTKDATGGALNDKVFKTVDHLRKSNY